MNSGDKYKLYYNICECKLRKYHMISYYNLKRPSTIKNHKITKSQKIGHVPPPKNQIE